MFHRRLYPALAPVFHIAHAADKETSSDVQKPYIARPDMANWRGKIRIGHDDASRIPLATVYSKEESASRRVCIPISVKPVSRSCRFCNLKSPEYS